MRDWEACYQNGETPWDKGFAAPPLIDLTARLGPGLWGGGTVLVPGCGLGHDVRWLAGQGLTVTGLDISTTAVDKARSLPPVGRETYETGDFLSADWPGNDSPPFGSTPVSAPSTRPFGTITRGPPPRCCRKERISPGCSI